MENNEGRTRRLRADKKYLVFPRRRDRRGDGLDSVVVQADGTTYMSVHGAALASQDPDFYTFLDLSLMQGRQLAVTVEGPNAAGAELIRATDEIPCRYPLYHEPGRPCVHFSTLRGWLNDPSGMIFYDGLWHLYYANTRFANRMAGADNAWGHAVSSDLLHWREMPLFLTPVRGECSFWTGGAAVDAPDTTGLGGPDGPALVFCANNGSEAPDSFTQCVFASTDRGMSCRRDPQMMYKPLPQEESRRGGNTRDPMILWYEPERKWVLVVYNQPPGGERSFFFFESRDLKNWTETGVLEGMYECPNLFELPVDSDPGNRRWVIWGSSTEYMIGGFDGRCFRPDGCGKLRAHYGPFTASQVFANAPAGRVVQIGWAHCCNYDGEFSQMASFPLDLRLRATPRGVRLSAQFVPELRSLRMEGWVKEGFTIAAGLSFGVGDTSQPMEVLAEIEPAAASTVAVTGADLLVRWDAGSSHLRVQRERAALEPRDGVLRLHLLLDVPSVEVVANDGESYILAERDYRHLGREVPLQITAGGGSIRLRRLEVYPLRSIHDDGATAAAH